MRRQKHSPSTKGSAAAPGVGGLGAERAGSASASASADGRTRLHDAALDDDTDALLALLAAGADPNAVDGDGATALHCAAYNGALGALEVLLAAQAHVDAQDNTGNTPLMIAVTSGGGDARLVVALLGTGADPGLINRYDKSPAAMAELLGYVALLELLTLN